MDARQMKKVIQYEALTRLKREIKEYGVFTYDYETMLDKENVSLAQIRRFVKVMDEMIETAESKI
jgi:hypothetical protein